MSYSMETEFDTELDKIRKICVCTICSEPLKAPVTFPCLHMYCQECVHDSKSNTTSECPQCTNEDTTEAITMTPSVTMGRIHDVLHPKAPKTKTGEYECSVCVIVDSDSKTKAVAKCIECDQKLCENCVKMHGAIKLLKDHNLIDLPGDNSVNAKAELDAIKASHAFCLKHTDKPLEYVCEIDKTVLCPTCCIVNHPGHICTSVTDAAESVRESLKLLLDNGNERIGGYTEALENAGEFEKDLKHSADEGRTSIENDRAACIAAINKTFDEMKASLDKVEKTCLEANDRHVIELKQSMSQIEHQMSQITILKAYGHPSELVTLSSAFEKKSRDWAIPPSPRTDYRVSVNVTSSGIFDNRIEFGNVTTSSIKRQTTLLAKSVVVQCKLLTESVLNDLDVLDSKDVVATTGNVAMLYDSNFKLKKKIEGQNMWSVTSMSRGNIAFTHNSDVISIYDKDGDHIHDLQIENAKYLRGIATDVHGNLVVSDLGSKVVSHIDIGTGETLSKTENASFLWPGYVTKNSKDVTIVSDYDADCIIAIDRNTDQELFRYGKRGAGDNEMNNPRDVCTDCDDNIIVADSANYRVVLLSPEGKLIRYLLTEKDGLQYPWGLAIDSDENLLVGDSQGKVFVVKYRG
ncbi:unnamed protein product [Owenia fusiformis]|uniref:Uncharacterized protein n=1 Tax=Owenia fusiformis TaxID=6347 RepID=A0A8J1URI1_OWEFU|nr:unnamed protein product [Owenia fusiformis]